jgi:hypothetical protein
MGGVIHPLGADDSFLRAPGFAALGPEALGGPGGPTANRGLA